MDTSALLTLFSTRQALFAFVIAALVSLAKPSDGPPQSPSAQLVSTPEQYTFPFLTDQQPPAPSLEYHWAQGRGY